MAISSSVKDLERDKFIEAGDNEPAVRVINFANFIQTSYDYIALTYVSAGNGAGEIETVTYKSGGSSGTTIATLTITYNGDDKIETITKS